MCVRLRLAPRDEALPFSLSGTVVRVDSDGIALNFDPLGDSEFQRLKSLVGSFLLREWQEVLTQCEPGQLQGTRGSISNKPLEDSRATSGPPSRRIFPSPITCTKSGVRYSKKRV